MFSVRRVSDKPIEREISKLQECGRNLYPIQKDVTYRREKVGENRGWKTELAVCNKRD